MHLQKGYDAGLCGRYHHNVSGSRLEVHVRKGYNDGLYISSAASAGGSWAIIMDAGTGFFLQCYHIEELHSMRTASVPWLTDKWRLGFHITAIAGTHIHVIACDRCARTSNACRENLA